MVQLAQHTPAGGVQQRVLGATVRQPHGEGLRRATAILRRCRWTWGSCNMDEDHIDCGEGAGFLAPPAPPPPMICDELPKLENLSERDPPQECIFYKNDEAACAKAFIETPNGVVRCAWNGHSCRMHYGVGGELCQAQKIEAELRAAVGDERAAEAALAAKAHALEEELLRRRRSSTRRAHAASAAASGSTFGAACRRDAAVARPRRRPHRPPAQGDAQGRRAAAQVDGDAAAERAARVEPQAPRDAHVGRGGGRRRLGRNGYDERTNAAYDDAERGEPEGMPFENVELESPHGSPEAARARSDVGSRRGPPRGGSGGGGRGAARAARSRRPACSPPISTGELGQQPPEQARPRAVRDPAAGVQVHTCPG